ncbi:transposase [Bacillaceae bacterium IKA-2]|nr:transposase [Bacillaceae bacterium IKA-2]
MLSRKRRVWYPGASYHITARGNRRTALFEGKQDYLMYLAILEDVRSIYPFTLHAYCLMTNHIHLQLQTKNVHIKEIMKELHSRYAVWFNKEHHYTGHLFQGRYGANVIDTDAYYVEVSRYIHLNPVEANMVHRPQDYRWSSYKAYISGTIDTHVTTTKVLAYFPQPRHIHYQAFVERKEKLDQVLEELKKWKPK